MPVRMSKAQAIVSAYSDYGDSFFPRVRRLNPQQYEHFNLVVSELLKSASVIVYRLYHGGYDIRLMLSFSPYELLCGGYTIELFKGTSDELRELKRRFSIIVQDTFTVSANIDDWQPYRVEYAANMYVSNIQTYMDMLAKSAKSVKAKDYEDVGHLTGIRQRSKHRRNSSTTTYNKQEQMIQRHPERYDNLCNNCIRFEKQCGRQYLKEHFAAWHNPYGRVLPLLAAGRIKAVLTKAWNVMYPSGDFYSLRGLYKIIEESDLTRSSKTKLRKFAKTIAHARSIRNTRHRASDGVYSTSTVNMSRATLYNRLRRFEELNACPISIPERWGIDFLPSPFLREWREYSLTDEFDLLGISPVFL